MLGSRREFSLLIERPGLDRLDHLHAAHVGLKHFRYRNAAIRVLVILKNRDKRPRRGDRGAVKSVEHPLVATFFTTLDVEAPRLPISAVRARHDLLVLLGARHPGLHIVFLGCDYAQVACADVHHLIRKLKALEELFSILYQLLMELPALFRDTIDYLLDLRELVNTEQAFLVDAVGADLFRKH